MEAILPLSIVKRHGLRILQWAAKDHSDYCDAIASADANQGDSVNHLWRGLVEIGGFDLIYLNHIAPDAAIRPILQQSAIIRLHEIDRPEACLKICGGSASGDEWFRTLSRNARHHYTRGNRYLSNEGSVVFRQWSGAEPLDPIIDRIAALKQHWLARRRLQSTLFSNASAPLKAFVRVMAEAGILRLSLMECGDLIVAGSINFVHDSKLMGYLSSYDEAYKKTSPGTNLMINYVRQAFDDGLNEVDLLRGDEEYKRKFATERVKLTTYIGGRTSIGLAASAFERCRAKIRN